MVTKMYCIYDRKTEIHHPPHFCHNIAHALRHFRDIFSDTQSQLHRYPEDFQIFEVGAFDDKDACLMPQNPHMLCSGTELVAPTEVAKGTRPGREAKK